MSAPETPDGETVTSDAASDSTVATDGGTASASERTVADRIGEVSVGRIGLYVVLVVMVGFYLVPLETGLVTSFKTLTGVAETLPFMPSTGDQFTIVKWQEAFNTLGIGLFNSALYAVPATIISAFLGSIAAYGLTQANWKNRYKALFMALFVAGIFIPYQAVLVPLTRFWSGFVQLGNLFSFVGIDADYSAIVELIVTHVAYGIPICTILFRAYYKNMNEEMVESARLDGATLRRVYRRIIFPLSTPMFAVVLIYQFTQIWNDLLFALVLIGSSTNQAAPVVLKLAGLGVAQEGTDFGLQMAGALITALPTIAIYVLFAEEFSEGVAA